MDKKEIIRCGWCGTDKLYQDYHDQEWGKEVQDDRVLFEFLVLESAQAGLSWITILRKRESYHRLFAGFDPVQVVKFTQSEIEAILQDPGIVRNRLKVQSTVSNARVFLDIQEEFGTFYQYLYQFMPDGKPIVNTYTALHEVPASAPISDTIAKDLKKRGMKFFGTTICYAYMQAVGMVNDHLMNCSFRFPHP